MDKIKIYTDFEKISDIPHFGYVFPLIEYLYKKNETLLAYYEIVQDISEADYVALPIAVEYLFASQDKAYFNHFLQKVHEHNKKVLVFTSGDVGKTIHDENVITIRLGGFKSKFPCQTFIMPPFIEDPLLKMDLSFSLLKHQEQPTIGFVGHSASGIKKWIKEFLIFVKGLVKRIIKKDYTDFQSFYPSSLKRHQLLMELKNKTQIKTDFIFREKYRAGLNSDQDRKKTTAEFFKNIEQNPYTFCMRGGGNFSVRFYETLAMGRIPLLVDTDCKLPFENIIDWDKHIVKIEESNFGAVENEILKFHNRFEEKEFEAVLKENRKLWEEYFTKEGYFISLYHELKILL